MLIDHHKFVKAGAFDCGNSDYCLVKTTCCATSFVLDKEIELLSFDPIDLSKRLLAIGDDLSCPRCHSRKWSYQDIADVNEVTGEWLRFVESQDNV